MSDEVFDTSLMGCDIQELWLVLETNDGLMDGTPQYGIPPNYVAGPPVSGGIPRFIGGNIQFDFGYDPQPYEMQAFAVRTYYGVVNTFIKAEPKLVLEGWGPGLVNLLSILFGVTGDAAANGGGRMISFSLCGKVTNGSYTWYFCENGCKIDSATLSVDPASNKPPTLSLNMKAQFLDFSPNGNYNGTLPDNTGFLGATGLATPPSRAADNLILSQKDFLLTHHYDDPDGTTDDTEMFTFLTGKKWSLTVNQKLSPEPTVSKGHGSGTTYFSHINRWIENGLEMIFSVEEDQYISNLSGSIYIPDKPHYILRNASPLPRILLTANDVKFRFGRYYDSGAKGISNYYRQVGKTLATDGVQTRNLVISSPFVRMDAYTKW